MSFRCFVCEKYFSRAQDRTSHLRLKKDDAHKQYYKQQQETIIQQFSTTVEAATSAAANIASERMSLLSHVSVKWNDVDQDDMPTSSWDMDIDPPQSQEGSDDEQSMMSGDEVPVIDNEENDPEPFLEAMDAASHALGITDSNAIPEAFDFLPDPELDRIEDEAGPRPSTAQNQATRRTLVEIDAEQPTHRWHQTAGQIYGQDTMIHARWKTLFNTVSDSKAYHPFNSRLDWEIAQWTVKEKIPQKSFDRLLDIPEVALSFS